jgi:hypothetical protein
MVDVGHVDRTASAQPPVARSARSGHNRMTRSRQVQGPSAGTPPTTDPHAVDLSYSARPITLH